MKKKCYYGLICENYEDLHRESLTHDNVPIFVKKKCNNGDSCNMWKEDPFNCPFWHGMTIQERCNLEGYSNMNKNYILEMHADTICPNDENCDFKGCGCPYKH